MKSQIKIYALLILAAILYGLGYPTTFSTSLLITPIIAISILSFLIIQASTWKSRFGRFLFFNSVLNLFSFLWITHTLQEFGNLPWILAFGINLLFAFIIGPHFWVMLIAAYLLDKKTEFKISKLMDSPLYGAVIATVFAFVEFYFPTQFPSNIGAPWIAAGPYIGHARWGGVAIYSMMSYWIIFEVLRFKFKRSYSPINISIILVFIISSPIIAFMNKMEDRTKKNLNIRMVQANISNFLKVDAESGSYPSVQQVLTAYKDLSLMPYETGKLDLIIWPETAYPYSIATNKENISDTIIPAVFADITQAMDSQMLVGGYDEKISGSNTYYESEYNSAFHFGVDAKIKDIYHKQILIPFGETLPFGPLNKYLRSYLENIAFFAKGTTFPEFKFNNGVSAIGAICYEILEPDFIRHYLSKSGNNPELIINLTNDSWYGDTAEPRLHLFMSKWRSIENDVTIVRSTNTGITTVVYPDGSESKNLGIFKAGNLDLSLDVYERRQTFFGKYGIWPIIPILLIYLIFHLMLLKLYRYEQKS